MTTVVLPDMKHTEILFAANVGIMRQVQNLRIGRKPAYGAGDENDWQRHVEGALGEYAFAKYTGRFWSGAFEFRQGDVGPWQVRCRSKHSYDLILHPEDKDDACFILLTGRNGSYQLHGWILGSDGKNDQWWDDPAKGRPAFFVPKDALLPLDADALPSFLGKS